MKKLLLSSLVLAASLSSFAYYGETKLTISSAKQKSLTIMVDGNTKTTGYNNTITISDLSGGSHNVKIYEEVRNGLFGRRSNKILYDGNMYLRPDYQTSVTINGSGNIEISEQPLYTGKDYGKKKDTDGWKDNKGKKNDNRGGWNNGGGNYNHAMDARSFEQAKQSIRRESFDNTKQGIAKQVLGSNYFSAAQVKEIVQLFSFDNSKLEIAKYAYSSCIDKGNYYLINDAFSFSSSRDELARYIQSVR